MSSWPFHLAEKRIDVGAICVEGLCLPIMTFGRRDGTVAEKRGGHANSGRIGDRQRVSPPLAGKPENGSGRCFAPPPPMRGEFVNLCTAVLVACGVAEDGIAKAILPVVRKLRADRARRQRRPTL